jgi:hypothetical protein
MCFTIFIFCPLSFTFYQIWYLCVVYEKTEVVPPSDFPSKTNVHLRHWVPKNLKPRTQFFTHRFQQHDRKYRGWTLVLKSDEGTISVFSYTTSTKFDKK